MQLRQWKSGDINPINHKRFWRYSNHSAHGEHWLTEGQFHEYRRRCNAYARTHREARAAWIQDHPAKMEVYYRRALARKRKPINPAEDTRRALSARIANSLRSRISHAIKRNSKASKSLDLVGLSIAGLRSYLESKFTHGMTWDNYGKAAGCWSIDHQKPCALFDFSDPSQQSQCFHYTNLQPMWHAENMMKRAKFP